jgi:hypothetical protein
MTSKNCVNCGQEFVQRTGERDKRFSSRKYCSLYCCNHIIREEIEKVCLGCNANFSKLDGETYSRFMKRKYCSHKCYLGCMNNTLRRLEDVTGIEYNGLKFLQYLGCEKWKVLCRCGEEFITSKREIKSKSLKSPKSCKVCSKKRYVEFAKSRTGSRNPFWNPSLTDDDRAKSRRGLNLDHWRTTVFTRDNFRCKICDCGGKINAHHLDGWKWAIDRRYDPDNGVTLCVKHHIEFHKLYGSGDNTAAEFFEYYLCTRGTTSG